MRVAHCIHGLGLGGAQQVVREIVAHTDREAFEFFVYTPEDGFFRELLEDAGAIVRVIPRRLARFDPIWVKRLADAMRRDDVDLVHAHLFGDTLHGYLAARLAARPTFVMTLHCDLRFQTALQRRGYRWLLGRRTTPVACSEAARQSVAAVCQSTFATVRVIPNGVSGPVVDPHDAEARARGRAALGLDDRPVVIAGIGRLDEDKGPGVLLSAFAAMEPTAGHLPLLLFAGEGSLEGELRDRAKQMGLAGRVVFAGLRQDIRKLLPAIDIVAFSSPAEGLSMALLESMAAGVCIVASDVPGNREAVRANVEALLAAPEDTLGLGSALARAVADPALRARLGEAAQRRYQADFTVEGMVRAYEALYRELEHVDVKPSVASRSRSGVRT